MQESDIIREDKFEYIDSGGTGEIILLLHGLFGALSNFQDLFAACQGKYRVVIPILPIYKMSLIQTSLGGLLEYIEEFVERKDLKNCHVLGNSLGGHLAILYTLKHPERVRSLTLTGSSGLFESAMGNTFPKRGDYEYIRKKTADTFYDPETATKELVDEVFDIVNDRNKVIRILAMAKSAIRHNIADRLDGIKCPSLLIWGSNDVVTPPFVGEKFNQLLPNSQLYFLDKTGHAPMMETPGPFNEIFLRFLDEVIKGSFQPKIFSA